MFIWHRSLSSDIGHLSAPFCINVCSSTCNQLTFSWEKPPFCSRSSQRRNPSAHVQNVIRNPSANVDQRGATHPSAINTHQRDAIVLPFSPKTRNLSTIFTTETQSFCHFHQRDVVFLFMFSREISPLLLVRETPSNFLCLPEGRYLSFLRSFFAVLFFINYSN